MSHCATSASDSSTFRARVECVLQAVMAHTATEMVRLFEEAVEALRTEGLQSRSFNLETILSTSEHTIDCKQEHTDTSGAAAAEPASDRKAVERLPAVEQVKSGEEALSLWGPVEDDDSTIGKSPGPSQARDVKLTGPSSHTAVRGQRVEMTGPPHTAVRGAVKINGPSSHTAVRHVEHKENMRADKSTIVSEEFHRKVMAAVMAAERLPAVKQVLSREEALSFFGPVEDDDCPGPSQARVAGPSSNTAVRDVEHKDKMSADKSTSVSEEGSQTCPVTAVKTEEDDMDDGYGGYYDSRSCAEPECSYNTDDELPGDDSRRMISSWGQPRRMKMRRGARCRACRKTYYLGPAAHRQECSAVLVYPCDHCGSTFDNWSGLLSHRRSHSRKTYNCTVCDKTFVLDRYRILHERREHSKLTYQCSDCGKAFEERLERDQHECRAVTGTLKFRCKKCKKRFNRQYILKKHQLAEHPEMFDNN